MGSISQIHPHPVRVFNGSFDSNYLSVKGGCIVCSLNGWSYRIYELPHFILPLQIVQIVCFPLSDKKSQSAINPTFVLVRNPDYRMGRRVWSDSHVMFVLHNQLVSRYIVFIISSNWRTSECLRWKLQVNLIHSLLGVCSVVTDSVGLRSYL